MNSHLVGSFSASQGLTSRPQLATLLAPSSHPYNISRGCAKTPVTCVGPLEAWGSSHGEESELNQHAASSSHLSHWYTLPQASHDADPLFGSHHPSLAHQSRYYAVTIPRQHA